MKIFGCQVLSVPGQPRANAERVILALKEARAQGADWCVFPELVVPGYFIGDRWQEPQFLQTCKTADDRIRDACEKLQVSAIWGNVHQVEGWSGEDRTTARVNLARVCENGADWLHPETGFPGVTKTLLPSYGPFDDPRYFLDTFKVAQRLGKRGEDLLLPVTLNSGQRWAVLVCEDIWDEGYGISPARTVRQHGPVDLAVVLSASPYTDHKSQDRLHQLGRLDHLGCPVLYVNHLSVQNKSKSIYVFDGSSQLMSSQGRRVQIWPSHQELCAPVEFTGKPLATAVTGEPIAEKAEVLRFGLKSFLKSIHARRVVVGASGGIDSAVVSALCRSLLPPEDVVLVNMPTRYNSKLTREAAAQLAQNLGCPYAEIPIGSSVRGTVEELEAVIWLGPPVAYPRGKVSELNLENIQARDRGSRVLAAVASMCDAVVVGCSNKTEMAVGWSTFYGDLIGAVAPLGDLWKTEVYELGRYLNRVYFPDGGIPEASFQVKPSAELGPAQDVNKGLGDPLHYAFHDLLFAKWMGPQRWSLEETLDLLRRGGLDSELGFTGSSETLMGGRNGAEVDIRRWWRAFHGLAVGKRAQAPPLIVVTECPFGPDFREYQGSYEDLGDVGR